MDFLRELKLIEREGVTIPLDEGISTSVSVYYDEIRDFGQAKGWPIVFGLVKDPDGNIVRLIATPDEDLSSFKFYCLAEVGETSAKEDVLSLLMADAQARADNGTSAGLG